MVAKKIAIEGSDGAGKATQTEMFVNYLLRHGFKVGRVSFPRYGETPAGKMLFEFLKSKRAPEYCFAEMNPKAASRIYAQDRVESLPFLRNLIENNDVVIFDRYVESNLLHQGGKLESDAEKMNFAKWLCDLEYSELALPQIDVTVYLDLPYTLSYQRALKRAEEKGEQLDAVESDLEYMKQSWYAGKFYSAMFNWHVVDCIVPNPENQLQAIYEFSPEEVHLKVLEVINIHRKV